MRTDRYDRVGQIIDCTVKDEWMDAAAPVKLHTPRALRVRAKTFFLKKSSVTKTLLFLRQTPSSVSSLAVKIALILIY